jgi:hypothetical protein
VICHRNVSTTARGATAVRVRVGPLQSTRTECQQGSGRSNKLAAHSADLVLTFLQQLSQTADVVGSPKPRDKENGEDAVPRAQPSM